jgi:hypothetical protein
VTDALTTTPEPLRFERSFTTEADYPRKITRGLFRYLLFTPRRLVVPGVILIGFIVIAIANVFSESSTESTYLLPGVFLLFYVLLYALIYFRTARTMRARIPAGSVFAVGFRNETFLLRSPQVSSEVAYSYYRSAERRGDFVVLKARATRATSLVPAEIFTEESLAYFQTKITSPTS